MNKVLYIVVFLLISLKGFSQIKIRGIILDSKSKNPIANANIIFSNHDNGTISERDGRFYIESKISPSYLVVSYVGYKTKKIKLISGFHELTIYLDPGTESLKEITYIAKNKRKRKRKRKRKKDNPAYKILKEIWKNKRNNGLKKLNHYEYDEYGKLEFDINNVDSSFVKRSIFKGIEFMFEKLDTSDVSKSVFLPIFINEHILKVYGTNDPTAVREDLIANKSSSFNGSNKLLQTFKRQITDIDIYKNYIMLFNKAFISPLSKNAWSFYNYTIVDTVFINKIKCFKIAYYPKRFNEFTFIGEFYVTDKDFIVKEITMDASQGINVNFVKDIFIEQKYKLYNDSLYLLSSNYISVDMGFIGNRKKSVGLLVKKTTSYKNYIFNQKKPNKFYLQPPDNLRREIYNRDTIFWKLNRHELLSKSESNIYTTIDSLNKTKKFKTILFISKLLATGYIDIKKWNLNIGNIANLLNINQVEGPRFRLSTRTFSGWDDPWRIQGYLGYGLKDKKIKYSLSGKWLIEKKNRLIIGLGYINDIFQLGGVQRDDDDILYNSFTSSNLVRSRKDFKLSSVVKSNGFASVEPWRNLMIKLYGTVQSITSASSKFSLAFKNGKSATKAEKTNDTHVGIAVKWTPKRVTIGNGVDRQDSFRDYPIIYFDYSLGIDGLFKNNFGYSKFQLIYYHPWELGLVGKLRTTIEFGKIFGTTPLSLLYIPPGNRSGFLKRNSFELLNYYEFITDKYASFNLEHHFNGKIFSKIPLVKTLKFREILIFKILWGDVSKENKNLNLSSENYKAPNDKLYYEYGLGIDNIGIGNFRIFRASMIWRGNYKETPNIRNFAFKLGLSFNF